MCVEMVFIFCLLKETSLGRKKAVSYLLVTHRFLLTVMAERVGFEPTYRGLTGNSISSRARYGQLRYLSAGWGMRPQPKAVYSASWSEWQWVLLVVQARGSCCLLCLHEGRREALANAPAKKFAAFQCNA